MTMGLDGGGAIGKRSQSNADVIQIFFVETQPQLLVGVESRRCRDPLPIRGEKSFGSDRSG